MHQSKIADYLDSASIDLFAQQIREAVNGVRAIAIHDSSGSLAWDDSQRDGQTPWPTSPFLRKKVPGGGFCERLENGNFVYVFYLCAEDDDEPAQTSARGGPGRRLALPSPGGHVTLLSPCRPSLAGPARIA